MHLVVDNIPMPAFLGELEERSGDVEASV